MLAEFNQVKRFLGAKFGIGENVPDGIYAIPTQTSRGDAFMKFVSKDNRGNGIDNFRLFWDENLTISWADNEKPESISESEYSKQYRKLQALL